MQLGEDRTGSQETQGKTDEWKKFGFIGDHQCKGVTSRIPCAVGEAQGERQLFNSMCFLIYSIPRWPSSCLLSPTFPAPTELELMSFPNWEGHGRSAGQVFRGFGPCSYQFLPGEAFLGLRNQLVFARLFKQNGRLWVMKWAVRN